MMLSIGRSVSRRWDYNWRRTYDPSIGRYLEADPIGQRGGITVYNYAQNRPGEIIDPTGLGPISAGVCVGVSAASLASTYFASKALEEALENACDELESLNEQLECATDQGPGYFARLERLAEVKKEVADAAAEYARSQSTFDAGAVAAGVLCSAALVSALP